MAAQYAIQPFFTNATLESYETPEGAENAKWWAEIAFTIVVIGMENYFNQYQLCVAKFWGSRLLSRLEPQNFASQSTEYAHISPTPSVSHHPELLEREVVLPLPHLPHRIQTGAARRHRRRRRLQHGRRAHRVPRGGIRTHRGKFYLLI